MIRKHFGQHFLRDTATIDAIMAAVWPQQGDTFIEIGPGEGVLTNRLLTAGATVTAIEIDRDLAAALVRRYGERLHLITADILSCDWQVLFAGKRVRVIGNLPYNISTPLLLRLAETSTAWHDCHIMIQKEVAERLCAPPGNADYGRLTVRTQLAFAAEYLLTVAATAFDPPPKVTSSVLRLTPHPQPLAFPLLADAVLRAAFQYRRKTLRNALVAFNINWDTTTIDGNRRAQTLSPQDFINLAATIPSTNDKIKK